MASLLFNRRADTARELDLVAYQVCLYGKIYQYMHMSYIYTILYIYIYMHLYIHTSIYTHIYIHNIYMYIYNIYIYSTWPWASV